MKMPLLAVPVIVGALAVAGCGGSDAPAGQATDATSTATTASVSRSAAAAIGRSALQVVNKTTQTVQVQVDGIDNFDWANGNRPDHHQPEGVQQAVLAPGRSVLARQLDPNPNATRSPFNLHLDGSNRAEPELGVVRLLANCPYGAPVDRFTVVGVDGRCRTPSVITPQTGDYTIRVVIPHGDPAGRPPAPTVPTVVTITSKSNPTW